MAANRVIGRGLGLPWHLPEDFRWFREATRGQAILMGRRSFESLPGGKPLPGRANLVLTRDPSFQAPPGVEVVRELAAFDPDTRPEALVFVGGGADVYGQMFPRCAEAWITHIHFDAEGDTSMPPFEDDFTATDIMRETPDFVVRRWINRRRPPAE